MAKIKQHQIKVTLPSNLYNEYKQLVLETTSEINLSQFTRFLIRKAVNQEKSNTKEGFTSDIREYFNKKRRDVRHKVEEFKTKTSNTVNKVYKKLNN